MAKHSQRVIVLTDTCALIDRCRRSNRFMVSYCNIGSFLSTSLQNEQKKVKIEGQGVYVSSNDDDDDDIYAHS